MNHLFLDIKDRNFYDRFGFPRVSPNQSKSPKHEFVLISNLNNDDN